MKRILFALLAIAGAAVAADTTLINGAGATFPFPIYSKWFSDYNKAHPNVQINYQSIGSGGGIKQITERTVDFGASDAPMSDEQIPKAQLPDTAITVVHRSDGSGTTNIFTDYLSKISPEWKAGPGKGTSVNWPVGLGGKGNEGVTGVVKQTEG